VLVCGRSPQEAARALELASVVCSRCLRTTGRINRADLPVDDYVLAAILQTLYADAPWAVAETVRALRKVGGEGDRATGLSSSRYTTGIIGLFRMLAPGASGVVHSAPLGLAATLS
jgi:hypothetical protein